MLSKHFEATEVDRRAWLHVSSWTLWSTSSDTHEVVQKVLKETSTKTYSPFSLNESRDDTYSSFTRNDRIYRLWKSLWNPTPAISATTQKINLTNRIIKKRTLFIHKYNALWTKMMGLHGNCLDSGDLQYWAVSLSFYCPYQHYEKKEEIWLSPMTKAHTPTEMSKGQSDNINNATKKFDYTAVADRLRTVSWSNYSHPTGVVNRFTGPPSH